VAEYFNITIKGTMDEKVLTALASVLPNLVCDAEISYIEYEAERDCFFFAASKATQNRHWRGGYVLSMADAKAGAWRTIYEPSTY